MTMRKLLLGLLSTCAAGALAGAALADPSARVGRVSFLEGEVSFVPPGENFWTPAARNFPVAPGESFWTDERGRAELQIGAVTVRLDNETEMDVLDLDYGAMRLSLSQGSMDVRVWDLPRGGVLISTPAGPVRLERAGIYRIDVAAPGDDGVYPPVEVTVLEGAARAGGRRSYTNVESGEAGLIYAGYDADLTEAYDASIDDWARRREASQRWARHPELTLAMTGVEDLDGHGEFVATEDYGTVWYPRDVPPGWAPYRYGHWAYVEPWGYTWIDDQPWGFAPFHYGRWVQIENRWAWAPGRPTPEPTYAPALVAFLGGSNWTIGIAGAIGAAVGWVPLAPDEIYRPTYRVSEAYVRQVNVTNVKPTTINNITINNVTNVTNITQYRNAPAATVVRAQAFSQGVAVQKAAVAVPAAVIARAPLQTEATRPPPAPQAKAAVPPGAAGPAGAPAAGPPRAAAPPARLQAVRTAVAAQPPSAIAPPVIAGARIAPEKPAVAAGQKPPLIAPAQVKAPQAQGREVIPTPHAPASPGKPTAAGSVAPAPGAASPRPAPPQAPLPKTPASPDARAEPPRAAAPVDVKPKPEHSPSKPAPGPAQTPPRAAPPEAGVLRTPPPSRGSASSDAQAQPPKPAPQTEAGPRQESSPRKPATAPPEDRTRPAPPSPEAAAARATAASEAARAQEAASAKAAASAAADAAKAAAAQRAAAERAQADKAAQDRAKAQAAAEAARAKASAVEADRAAAAQKAAAEKAQADKTAQEKAKAQAAAEAAKKRNPDADKTHEPAPETPR